MRIRFALVVVAGMTLALGLAASENPPEASEETPSSVWDGIYTLEQSERGEPLYARGCAECHGPDLGGDDMSPPLIGSDFVWDWNGLSVGDMFERLRISMPDGKPRSMTNQEKADVLAFMLLKNDFPAGDSELASSTRALSPIAFEAVKP